MKKKVWILFLVLTVSVTACNEDDTPTTDQLKLAISGLENLGTDFRYEGWLIVNATPVSTGIFDVNDQGELSQTSFDVTISDLASATTFVLTIEPAIDANPLPSDVHLLAGDVTNGAGTLSIGHAAALGNDFSAAAGTYILATPTNGGDSNENSGIWFLDPTAGPGVGLTLPTLPAGWKYEGWSVINGQPVTTGKFTALDTEDESAPFSGPMAGPPFPGEDFLVNAPSGIIFPTDLSETTAVISIEPEPDNSAGPFLLKPLVGTVPASAMDHTSYPLGKNLGSFPTGTVSK